MRALRRVVDARPGGRRSGPAGAAGRAARTAVAGVVIAAAAGSAAGCAKFNSSLGKQEAVVAFRPGTSQDAMMKVRSACSGLAGATPEAVPTGSNVTTGQYDVRFRIDQASDADIARLTKCLSDFRSVQGVNLEQQGN
jgi:hypothetical protein